MRQRVMIALALSSNPSILIADEPTTALDVTVQAQILDLMSKLQADFNSSIILITHNLGVVSQMAERVAVMYLGKIVELRRNSRAVPSSAAPLHGWPVELGACAGTQRQENAGTHQRHGAHPNGYYPGLPVPTALPAGHENLWRAAATAD